MSPQASTMLPIQVPYASPIAAKPGVIQPKLLMRIRSAKKALLLKNFRP